MERPNSPLYFYICFLDWVLCFFVGIVGLLSCSFLVVDVILVLADLACELGKISSIFYFFFLSSLLLPVVGSHMPCMASCLTECCNKLSMILLYSGLPSLFGCCYT